MIVDYAKNQDIFKCKNGKYSFIKKCVSNISQSKIFLQSPWTHWQDGSKHLCTHIQTHTVDTVWINTHTHTHRFSSRSRAEIFCSSHSWREILNNKYPANNECAAGCSCLGGIISNFLPMFHIPTPACRHSPSLHPNAGSYHFYLFFKSIYKSKPRQMRSNKLQSAGQMQNVNRVPGEKIPKGAARSALCPGRKSTRCHFKLQLTWILLSALFNATWKINPRPHLCKFLCIFSSLYALTLSCSHLLWAR